MTSSKAGVGVLLPLLLSLLLLAASNSARAFNPAYSDLSYWEQWALAQGYTISNYVYSEGNSTGSDGEIGNEFICIRDDVNQVIIGRPDVCGTYYNGLGYSYADITNDPTTLTSAPDIIDAITDNLVDPNLANWGGCNYTGINRGGTNPGGPMPNCGQDIINWSYGGYWVYRRHAIEQALKQAGVNVDGYQWEFVIKNNNGDRADQSGVDTLDIRMIIWDNSGNQVHHKQWVYNTKFDWTTFSGTELFGTPFVGQNLRDWQLQMYGRDSGFWGGFYGPEMKTPEIRMIYSSNPCAIDPLLHPDCEDYVDAYANYLYDQNCIANPLYDSGCPGYQQAFYDQQCTINPLYDMGCPGYQQAYFDQQCSFNALYDVACPGYQQAFFDQQCSLDPFYDTTCPGYAKAYFDQQCGLDPLYDRTCPGYGEAYAQKYILNEETTSPTETVSTTSQEIATIADPVQALTETPVTGDATIDAILGDLNEVPIATFSVEAEPVAAVETQAETQETEASTEADSTAEELVADVETESESSDESESTEESDGSDDESSDESEGKDSNGRDSKSEKKDSKNEKMRKAIAAKAANLANEMAAAATLEAQQAAQAQVLALINYVPDFNTYSIMMNGGYLPDAVGYPDTQVPESRQGLRNGLAQQLLHEQMVEMQYNNNRSQ